MKKEYLQVAFNMIKSMVQNRVNILHDFKDIAMLGSLLEEEAEYQEHEDITQLTTYISLLEETRDIFNKAYEELIKSKKG